MDRAPFFDRQQPCIDSLPSCGLTALTASSSPPKKPKNMKKLSLSTFAARKLTPSLHLSSSMPSTPQTAYRPTNRSPPKLPALNVDIMGITRWPSLPIIDDAQSPKDSSFSSLRRFQTDVVMDETDLDGGDLEVYKSGPVCIMSPNLWLYSEPTAEEARDFDMVINVAKEVPNPLLHTAVSERGPDRDFSREAGERNASPVSRVRIAVQPPPSLATEPNGFSDSSGSDCLPDADPKVDCLGGVEYVHMPWEHNQDLEEDLPGLTTLIDKKINLDNKRVLVHCKQGVSRSASLVIAYVMKAKSMDINAAYAYVKDKSAGVGPNMSLIYQLCEWGKTLKTASSTSTYRRSFDANGLRTTPEQSDLSRRMNGTLSGRDTLLRTKSESNVSLPRRKDLQATELKWNGPAIQDSNARARPSAPTMPDGLLLSPAFETPYQSLGFS